MARVFITGSSDGLGLMAGKLLVEQGHEVVLHARNASRANDTKKALPQASAVAIGDLSSVAETKKLAEEVNRLGRFDAVIHNAGVGYREQHIRTGEGLPHLFAINVLAPYILTALIERPKRLVYLSSGMHRRTDLNLDDLTWSKRRWQGAEAYAESKVCDVLIAFYVARHWTNVFSNALEPGWVPTKMGGPGAPDDLDQAHRTQVWLAVSDDPKAKVSGRYFFHMTEREPNPITHDADVQDLLISSCARLSGVALRG